MTYIQDKNLTHTPVLQTSISAMFIGHTWVKLDGANGLSALWNSAPAQTGTIVIAHMGVALLLLIAAFLKFDNRNAMTIIAALIAIPAMIVATNEAQWLQWHITQSHIHPLGGLEAQFILISAMLYLALFEAELISFATKTQPLSKPLWNRKSRNQNPFGVVDIFHSQYANLKASS